MLNRIKATSFYFVPTYFCSLELFIVINIESLEFCIVYKTIDKMLIKLDIFNSMYCNIYYS